MIGDDLGQAIVDAIDALPASDKTDQLKVMKAMAGAIADHHNPEVPSNAVNGVTPSVAGNLVKWTGTDGDEIEDAGVASSELSKLHEHTNKTQLDAITNAGSGLITTATERTNWNNAYSWGNHSGLYLPVGGGTLTGNLTVNGYVARKGISAFRNNGTDTGFTGAVQNLSNWNNQQNWDSDVFNYYPATSPYLYFRPKISGWFKISYNIGIRNDHTSRLAARIRMCINTDTNVIASSLSYTYARMTEGEESSIVNTFLANLTANTYYRLVVDGEWAAGGWGAGGGSFAILDESSWIMEYIG